MSGQFRVSRPKCRAMCELPSLAILAATVAAVLASFPGGTAGMEAAEPSAAGASCAFVALSAASEAKALEAARTAWQLEGPGARRLRIEMLAEALPEERAGSVADVEMRTRRDRFAGVDYAPSAIPPTVAAPPPERLSDDAPEAPAPAFPKEELLGLGKKEKRT